MGRGSEQYWEPQEYDRQLAKRARTIAEALQGCTIIGLQELGKPEDAAAWPRCWLMAWTRVRGQWRCPAPTH
ncbi:MAG: hypothetical protein R2867_40305 [Caldilineaceae bacterium]